MLIKAVGLYPNLLLVFRNQDGSDVSIMILKAYISSLLETFVAFLGFEHFVENIWERANGVLMGPRKHYF
jgi:hypothetical protein